MPTAQCCSLMLGKSPLAVLAAFVELYTLPQCFLRHYNLTPTGFRTWATVLLSTAELCVILEWLKKRVIVFWRALPACICKYCGRRRTLRIIILSTPSTTDLSATFRSALYHEHPRSQHTCRGLSNVRQHKACTWASLTAVFHVTADASIA